MIDEMKALMEQNNELIDTLEAYKIRVIYLRRMLRKAHMTGIDNRLQISKIERIIEEYEIMIEALRFHSYNIITKNHD